MTSNQKNCGVLSIYVIALLLFGCSGAPAQECVSYTGINGIRLRASGGTLRVTSEDGKELYKKTGGLAYIVPLSDANSEFASVWTTGSGYETIFLNLTTSKNGPSVTIPLDAFGKGFPEIIAYGAEGTAFVLIPYASKIGDLIDKTDVYVGRDGKFDRAARVPFGDWMPTVMRISSEIDKADAERRKGVVVHP